MFDFKPSTIDDLNSESMKYFKIPKNPLKIKEYLINIMVEQSANLETMRFLMSYYYAPNLWNLNKVCKNSNYIDNCLKISETLINNSDIPTAKLYSYRIKSNIYKTNNEFEKFENSIIKEIKLTKIQKCQSDDMFFTKLFTPLHQNTIIDNVEATGLNKAEEMASKFLHEYIDELAIESTYSAKDCKKIQNLTNQEFYQTYGNDDGFKSRMAEYEVPIE